MLAAAVAPPAAASPSGPCLRSTTAAAEGQIALDHKYPKIYKKVTKFYMEKGVEFKDDPCDDYEILLDCLYADLVTEGIINE